MALKPQAKLEYQRAGNAMEDFKGEIEAQCARNGLKTNAQIGQKIGVSAMTASTYRKEPGRIGMVTMQKIVGGLHPDIEVVLKFLGYSNAEITKFARRALE